MKFEQRIGRERPETADDAPRHVGRAIAARHDPPLPLLIAALALACSRCPRGARGADPLLSGYAGPGQRRAGRARRQRRSWRQPPPRRRGPRAAAGATADESLRRPPRHGRPPRRSARPQATAQEVVHLRRKRHEGRCRTTDAAARGHHDDPAPPGAPAVAAYPTRAGEVGGLRSRARRPAARLGLGAARSPGSACAACPGPRCRRPSSIGPLTPTTWGSRDLS